MDAELTPSVDGGPTVRIPAAGRVEIFRDPDRRNEVVARVTGDEVREVGLGVHDVSVSRRGTPENPRYVKAFLDGGTLFVVDTGMSEAVELEDVFETVVLTEGERYAVHQDSNLNLGYDTTVRLRTSRDRRGVPPMERIRQTRKWLERGTTREVLREAEGLLDLLESEAGEDGDVAAEAHEEFAAFVDDLRDLLEYGQDRGEDPVPPAVRQSGNSVLDRLAQLYVA